MDLSQRHKKPAQRLRTQEQPANLTLDKACVYPINGGTATVEFDKARESWVHRQTFGDAEGTIHRLTAEEAAKLVLVHGDLQAIYNREEGPGSASVTGSSRPLGLRSGTTAQSDANRLPATSILGRLGLPVYDAESESGWQGSIMIPIPGQILEWRSAANAEEPAPEEKMASRRAAVQALKANGFCTTSMAWNSPVQDQPIVAFRPEDLANLGRPRAEQFIVGWSPITPAITDALGNPTIFGLTGSEDACKAPKDGEPTHKAITKDGQTYHFAWDQQRFDQQSDTFLELVDGNGGGWSLLSAEQAGLSRELNTLGTVLRNLEILSANAYPQPVRLQDDPLAGPHITSEDGLRPFAKFPDHESLAPGDPRANALLIEHFMNNRAAILRLAKLGYETEAAHHQAQEQA